MKKENQRIVLTRRLLLEALLQLLEKKHINDISVTELCNCAGINRATFYKHYATPNDVFSEYVEKHIAQLLEMQNPMHGKSQIRILEECCEYIHAHAELFRLFAKNHMDEDFSRKVFLRMLQQSSSADAMQQSGFDENDIKLTTSYVASGYYYLIRRWLVEDIQKTPKEIAALLLRLSPSGLISK
jgi:AcrR family transcriptional regulator